MSLATVLVINPQTLKIQRNPRRRRSIIRQFALTTSAHGIPGIARSQSKHNRIFWSICFTAFVAITLYFVIREIRNYFDYSTQTSVNMINEWPQYFPAFTICNLVPIRSDRFIKPFLDFTDMLNITRTNDSISISSNQAKYIGDFLQIKVNQNESFDEFFFPLDTMLIKCTFNGRSCSTKNFTSFYSSTYGLCYTFNAKLKNMKNIQYSDEYGGPGNLNLRFYVHSHQYVPYIREGIGMIGMVHNNVQLPLIDSAGIALATGFKHRITYTKKTISYLRAPYSTCDDKIPSMMQAMFDNYQGAEYEYSEDICYELCTQVYVYQQCGCINPKQWNARSVLLPDTKEIIIAPLCNISDKCYSQAGYTFLTSSSLLDQYCSYCSQQCSITSFNLKTSMWKTPPTWLLDDIKKFVETSQIPLPIDWSTNWRSHIDSSYLSIELIHESNLVENYTQTETMTAVDVLSNVGGQTGLWIGVSFLSLMELAEMLYRLIRHQYYAIRRSRNNIEDDNKI
ncbi:unnamed protein product [Adineta steineri]|uniref:Uncharacterized protein n=1 Tax=Adineta steineri TaxID=433720 RepID=A0A813R7Y8_9BILA|nr:unnamed protein product [Adineta steineri]CAF3519738.1 unnamed protein product [Adineta steineri]